MAWSGYLCEVVLILVGDCLVGGWAEVAEGGVEAAGVVPADVVEDGPAGGGPGGPGLPVEHSVLMVAKNDSATALSQHWPVRPTDSRHAQSSARRGVLALTCIGSRGRSGRPHPGRGRRLATALVRASSIRSVRRWSAVAQPTTRREREVDDGGQVQPAFPGVDVGDVAAPAGVDLRSVSTAKSRPIRSGGTVGGRVGHGGGAPPFRRPAAQPGGPHQPGDAFAGVPVALARAVRRAPAVRRRCRSTRRGRSMICSVSSASTRRARTGWPVAVLRSRRSGRPSAARTPA